eukprot:m.49910 g.49910  ORF g.49910 m.49910 type:complete len:823 (+) comp11127_c1_seq1:609-3077(+)
MASQQHQTTFTRRTPAVVCVLDLLLALVLFFAAGADDGRSYLQNQVLNFAWNASVLDVVIVSLLRSVLMLLLLTRAVKATQPSRDAKTTKSQGLLVSTTALFLALVCLGFTIAKLVILTKQGSPLRNAGATERRVTLALVACALTFSLVELMLAFNLRAAIKRGPRSLSSVELLEEGKGDSEEEDKAKPSKANLKRLASLAKPERTLIAFGTIFLLISGASGIVAPLYFGKVIDAAADPAQGQKEFHRNVLILGLIYLMGAIATFLRAWLFGWAGQRLVARVRKDVFAAIIRQDIGFFDVNRTGELTNRLASDTTVIQSACTESISSLVRYILQIVGSLVLMFTVSWKLTLVLLSVVPPIAIGAVWYGGRVKKLGQDFQDELAKGSAVAEESISSIRTVRSFDNEVKSKDEYNTKIEDSFNIGYTLALVRGGFTGATGALAQMAILLVLWYGGVQVSGGEMTAGTLSGFMLYSLQVAMAFAFISSLFGEFMKAVGASVRLFELMDRVPDSKTGDESPTSFEPTIELNQVDFHYPSRPESRVLKNMTFSVPSGTVVALVGPSGGGKSTVVSLLERFYQPTAGSIKVGGQDIQSVTSKWLHSHVALVGQEPVLFAVSIRDNILYGRSDATEEQLIQAAKMANAHDFILNLDEGYDAMVGERGVRLSGGQKQRIAIARALLMDPQILLLDEATSALDAESEHAVQEAIDRAMVGRTVLVIAHRLSTVRDANQVLVISKGEIAEQGTHDSLVQSKGIYYRLVQRQLQKARQTSTKSEGSTSAADDLAPHTLAPVFGNDIPTESDVFDALEDEETFELIVDTDDVEV